MDHYQQTRRSSDLTPAQVSDLAGKIDKLESTLNRVLGRLDLLILPRIASVNAKVDKQDEILSMLKTLVGSLAEDEEDQPRTTLDGEPAGYERDASQSLG